MCLVVRVECTMGGEGMRREVLALAIEALSWMDLRRINGRLALRRTAKQLGVRDEPVLREAFRLIMEATRRRNAVDHLAAQALGQEDLEGLNLGVRSFLRIYASEVKYGERTFQEVVGIAAQAREILGSKALAPVEEALDLIPHLEVRFEGLPEDEATALRTFYPAWYVRYCTELLGRREALLLLQAPDLEGAELEGEPGLEHVFRVVDQNRPLNLLESYRGGLFTLQDKASILAGVVAAPEPGMTVLDVCAAPGAKTSHLAQLMGNRGRILSLDFSERRLETWKREMARLGVENAEPVLGDAIKPGAFPDVDADLVIVDPPCTGTGTFNHIPSGKWRLSRRSIDKMAFIQREPRLLHVQHNPGGERDGDPGLHAGEPRLRFGGGQTQIGAHGVDGSDRGAASVPTPSSVQRVLHCQAGEGFGLVGNIYTHRSFHSLRTPKPESTQGGDNERAW
jgi:16S rRNA (cytosine967-C5)-methyltransferase